VFGDRPVNAIDSADVLKALSPIWTTKPETARRLKQRIKVVLDKGGDMLYKNEKGRR
jgi:hypothetical protein